MKYGANVDQLIEKEALGMPSPALDSKPYADNYTNEMVSAYSYIQKGSDENGNIPVSEVKAYWELFEEDIPEEKHDFVYIMYKMNEAVTEYHAQKMKEATKKG